MTIAIAHGDSETTNTITRTRDTVLVFPNSAVRKWLSFFNPLSVRANFWIASQCQAMNPGLRCLAW